MAAPKGVPHPTMKGNQYAKGHGCGRPLIFDDDFIANEAAALLEWIEVDNDDKIYLGTFALSRGYHRQKLTEFSDVNKVFHDAYKKAKQWQEQKFIKNGLTKKWDPGFTQYVMARVCDPIWKKSGDANTDESLKALATAVMNYATAQPAGEGWQKPEKKKK